MIATVVIVAIFLTAFVVTIRLGIAGTFAYVLLPAVLLLFTISPLEIYKLPDVSTLSAVGYGTVAAYFVKGGEPLGIRFNFVDAIMVALSLIAIVSAVAAEQIWTGVSTFGSEALEWVLPYFMARVAFAHREWRLPTAKVLVGIACALALIALIEMRFDPLFFSRRVLRPFGLTTSAYELVLKRFALFRAQATFSHPIDLGNGGALLACMILVLAGTGGRSLRTPWVLAGVVASCVMIAASISFTAIVAIGGVAALFAVCRLSRYAGLALLPAAILVMVGYAGLTQHFVDTPLPVREYTEEATLSDSANIRQLIVQSAWPYASTAGFFGYGRTVSARDMGLQSVDNGYLLFIISRGWLYFGAFVLLLFAVAATGGRAIARIADGTARTPVAAGVAGIMGIMMGMYTVFFGFVYARLFVILLGLTVSMCQEVFARTRAQEAAFAARPNRPAAPAPAGGRLSAV